MTSYRLFDGVSGRPGVGSSGTQPPSTSTSFGGAFVAGTMFQVTQDNMYIEGFWWWRADTAAPGGPQPFCLWSVRWDTGTAPHGFVIPGSSVTSGNLSVGMNYVPYTTPLALARGMPYRAQTGFTGNFPDSLNQMGLGNPYAAGITNGPLMAYSDTDGSAPSPGAAQRQGGFDTASADPTVDYAGSGETGGSIYWVDVQVRDTIPAGITSYRLWPNMQFGGTLRADVTGYTIGTEFHVTSACALDAIWYFSPPSAAGLPTRCLLWDANTQLAIAGTDNAAPSWVKAAGGAAAAGDGFVKVDYTSSNVTLVPGKKYVTSVFRAPGDNWFADIPGFWSDGSGGLSGGTGGLAAGPLAAPNNAGAVIGQSSDHAGAFAFPATSDAGANDWTDVEVTPLASPAGILAAPFDYPGISRHLRRRRNT